MNTRKSISCLVFLILLIPCLAAAQVEGLILDIDEGLLYLDRGSAQGMEKNQICDVFDENGKKVSVIYITEVEANRSTAKFSYGDDGADIGQTFRTRTEIMESCVFLEVFQAPVESSFGDEYQALASTADLAEITSALGLRAGIGGISELSSVTLGAGVMMMDDQMAPFLDMDMSVSFVAFVNHLFLFLKARGGVFSLSGQPYLRPAGGTYEDDLPNEGTTDRKTLGMYGGSAGLRLHPNSTISLSAEVEWLGAGKGEDWGVAGEYVERSNINLGGLGYRAGLTITFGAFR